MKRELLKKHFGYDAFREGQETLIDAILAGQDVLGVMPTGAGKSVCYQLPALMFPGITLVVSPLISLMKDQVSALKQAGIAAAYLNSSLTPGQYKKALANAAAGMYKIIYVAPERLETRDFLAFAQAAPISLLAVDEAHCVSQWGHDFRPSYLGIAAFAGMLPSRPPRAAFTATANARVREDIASLLGLENPLALVTGFDRPNLFFQVERLAEREKSAYLTAFLRQRPGESGIIYCAARKTVEELCQALCAQGFAATRYHAGLSDEERRQNQEAFLADERPVMVATSAFGMGIDKSNVSYVIHYHMPKDIESYYQEAGRAGRDGSPAVCVLLYNGADVRRNSFLIARSLRENAELTGQQRALALTQAQQRLRSMTAYCTGAGCLRACLLRYFGETPPSHCQGCSNCAPGARKEDASAMAREIADCVRETGERYGPKSIAAIVMGEGQDERDWERFASFGSLAGETKARIYACIDAMLEKGHLEMAGRFKSLQLGPRVQELEEGAQYLIALPDAGKPPRRRSMPPAALGEEDEALYARLVAVRMRLAKGMHVPPYVIFTNLTLLQMSALKPRTPEEMRRLSGVGDKKLARYGEIFCRVIESYVNGADTRSQ